ncbi:MAG TPA: biotin/lipoyl-containing protein, partial [Thermoanaerobaculia bacterium]
MYEFRMPSLGADMEAGTLSRWLVHPGDAVKRGDVVALIETEKSDIEVEIFASGVVERLVVEEGQRVPVGTLLAMVRTNGEV